jgi:[protein-PII] uridylyltransferase
VDVHLLRAAAEMARILHRPDDPFAANAAAAVDDISIPLLGALLHDIGKVGRGSHVGTGASLARSILTRVGVSPGVADDVLFLVAEHLLLADTATRRNLHDEDLIVRVAATVGDPRRLAMLYLLTVADAAATGPHAQTPWRLGLVRELVAKVDEVFERGLMDRDRVVAVRNAEATMRGALGDLDGGLVDRFLVEVPAAYLTAVRPEDARGHVDLLVPPPSGEEVRVRHRPGTVEGTHVVTVSTADRPGVLADLAAAFALSRLSILSAQAFTTASGVALDEFVVRQVVGEDVGAETWARLGRELAMARRGSADAAERMRAIRAQYRPAGTRAPVDVRVDIEGSQLSTVVEVAATDRLGLLSDLARAFATSGLDVHAAKVATYGPRVVDVFYVTTAEGEPISDPATVEALREALVSAASA